LNVLLGVLVIPRRRVEGCDVLFELGSLARYTVIARLPPLLNGLRDGTADACTGPGVTGYGVVGLELSRRARLRRELRLKGLLAQLRDGRLLRTCGRLAPRTRQSLVVIGSGKRLSSDGTVPSGLKLVDSKVSSTGVVMGTYEPAGEIVTGSFALD